MFAIYLLGITPLVSLVTSRRIIRNYITSQRSAGLSINMIGEILYVSKGDQNISLVIINRRYRIVSPESLETLLLKH